MALTKEFAITLQVWALRFSGLYSNICKNMSIMFRICNDRAMEAIKKDAIDGSLEVGKFSFSINMGHKGHKGGCQGRLTEGRDA